jgi:uncharacterized protein DUF6644
VILHIAEWLESTSIALMVRESLWGFPIVVGLHLLGLAFSVGMIVWFDLRLLGVVLRGSAVNAVYRRIIPWASAGFFTMFVTGGMLFTGYATKAYGNPFFQIKMAALLGAGLNALFYHRVTERTVAGWGSAPRPPFPARAAGLLSIAVWTIVILAGRAMSYTMFSAP